MPVLLYYAVTLNSTGAPASTQEQQGWFGVNDAPNLINISGTTASGSGFPECTVGVIGSCYVVSVLKYLDYSNGLDAGFMLSKSTLRMCDIDSPGQCQPEATLTVGLTPSLESAFDTLPLDCSFSPNEYALPAEFPDYSVCQDAIPGALVSVNGAPLFNGPVLFDTGTPDLALNVPTATRPPSSVTDVVFALPNGFLYTLTAGSGVDNVMVAQSTSPSIASLPYFTTNDFLIDFSSSTEGWK